MSSNAKKTAHTESIRARSTAIIVCLALMLGLISTGYGDIIIGNFENPDSNDNWVPGWQGSPVLTPAQTTGVTLGSGSLAVQFTTGYWVLRWLAPSVANLPTSFAGWTLKFNVTFLPSDFADGTWVKVADKIALNSNVVQALSPNNPKDGYAEFGTATAVDPNGTTLDWGTWAGAVTKTYSLDLSDYNIVDVPVTWFQIDISMQLSPSGTGKVYVDNIRLVPPPPAIDVKKCTVTAGKTQYMGDGDYNDMQDTFTASGTIMNFPSDLSTLTSMDVNIVSADGNSIFFEPNDFNYARNVKNGKYTHSYKIPKGNPTQGAITSMAIDFNKKTFAVTVKNADLTGLDCPLQLIISTGAFNVSDEVGESIVNGPKTTIPTRLMRMYKDTLIVPPGKTKVTSKAKASSDSLSVTGEIAVEDIDTTDPNLYAEPVVISWSSADDTNSQTFTIPPHSFKIPKTGHLYKLNNNITPTVTPVAEPNSKVSGTIDLDKCTFTLSITKADLLAVSGQAKFGIEFGDFNEVSDVNLAWKK